jgi:hypothetical protein
VAVFRHEVTLTGCTREWFEQFVAEAHREVESLRFEDGHLATGHSGDGPADDLDAVVLVAGRHAVKGARYQIEPEGDGVSVTITDWNWARRTGI